MPTRGSKAGAAAACLICLAGLLAPAALMEAPGPAMAGKVMTVNGPIAPSELGITLAHEHVLIDFRLPNEAPETWAASGRKQPKTQDQIRLYWMPLAMRILGAVSMGAENRDSWLLDDEENAVAEITEYRWHGGRSIVDVTNTGLKRNPRALKRVSDAAGIHIVMGSGWYQRAWVGDGIDRLSTAELTDRIVRDIQVGVDDTGIRAGIIGELSPVNLKSDYDRNILQAAAKASRMTGAPISLDIPLGQAAPEIVLEALEVLHAAGADLNRVAVGHADVIALDMPMMQRLLQRGVYLQFDRLGDFPHVLTKVSDHDVAIAVIELLKQGQGRRLLLSQDVCAKTDLKAYGGSGYAFILEQYSTYIRQLGITKEQIQMILVENPQRLLSFAAPQED
jgi:phosphotriesterase-related protein